MKTRDLIIDADHITYLVSESRTYKNNFDVCDDYDDIDLEEVEVEFKQYKKHFKAIVKDYILTAKCAGIAYGWTIGAVKVIMSAETNFRFRLYPEYKNGRTSTNEVRTKLKAWARKKYIAIDNTEADDVVAYYVRKGGLGVTTDKDLYKGVEGVWFNSHYKHRDWLVCNKKDAEYFFKCQILAGDGVDGIPSLPRVGLPTADKLMKNHGSSYENIVKIFKMRGFTRQYMITMARLVCMSQWTPKKGIVLWDI